MRYKIGVLIFCMYRFARLRIRVYLHPKNQQVLNDALIEAEALELLMDEAFGKNQ